jgi:hypothetical protein
MLSDWIKQVAHWLHIATVIIETNTCCGC